MPKRKTAKQLIKAKLKAELREAKERVKELKNPFQKYIAAIDKLPKIVDTLVNVGLAISSFQLLGVHEEQEEVTVPYQVVEHGVPMYNGASVDDLLKSGFLVDWDKVTYGTVTKTFYKKELKTVKKYNPFAALYGPVAFNLAKSGNVVSGTVGTAGLALLGLVGASGRPISQLPEREDAWRHVVDTYWAAYAGR